MPGSALILVENLSVPFDGRVWLQSKTLRNAGWDVTVICPKGEKQDREAFERVDGVEIHRFPIRFSNGGAIDYGREYATAMWHMWRTSKQLARTRRFDVVQACNPPDFLLLSTLHLKRKGARLIFDVHDLVPELYLSRFERGEDLTYRMTVASERLAFRMADVVIATNESYRRVAIDRGSKRPEDVFVVRNGPDLDEVGPVEPDPALKQGRKHLIGYLGVMGPQDGIDHALRALALLEERRTDWHAIFVGEGDAWPDMKDLAQELGLGDRVTFTGRIPDEDLWRVLSTCDVCLAPDPKSPLNDISTMSKILEYMAMKRPLVSYDLVEARVSAGPAALYAEPNDEASFADKIAELLDDPEQRRELGEIGRARLEEGLSWAHSERALLAAYERALNGHSVSEKRARPTGSRVSAATAEGARLRVLIAGPGRRSAGGISAVIETLASSELAVRYELVIVETHRDGSKARKLAQAIAAMSRVAVLLAARRIDLAYLHASSDASFRRKAVLAAMTRLAGRPYVVHVHASSFDDYYREAPTWEQWLVRRTLSRAALVIALSPSWERRLRAIVSCTSTSIPNPVVIPADPAPLDVSPARIVCLGRLGERKGSRTLVRALSMLDGSHGAARLVLAGDGDRAWVASEALRLGVDERVDLPGWIGPDERARTLLEARVFALPAREEGLPVALLEAMAFGLPSVVSPVGGIPDVFEDGRHGYFVPPDDPEALAGKLTRILDDPEAAREMGERARHDATARFASDVVVARIADALDDAVQGTGPRRIGRRTGHSASNVCSTRRFAVASTVRTLSRGMAVSDVYRALWRRRYFVGLVTVFVVGFCVRLHIPPDRGVRGIVPGARTAGRAECRGGLRRASDGRASCSDVRAHCGDIFRERARQGRPRELGAERCRGQSTLRN